MANEKKNNKTMKKKKTVNEITMKLKEDKQKRKNIKISNKAE